MQLRLSTLFLAASLAAQQVSGLYFYIDGTSPKCFFEDLPKDTLVVGVFSLAPNSTPNKRLTLRRPVQGGGIPDAHEPLQRQQPAGTADHGRRDVR
jgi:hypothetical protein